MIKHDYFLRYGAVPQFAKDACTLPGYDGYLDKTRASRVTLVERRMTASRGETYGQALRHVLSALKLKRGALPLTANGFGSTADQVNMANALLASEKRAVTWQIADASGPVAVTHHVFFFHFPFQESTVAPTIPKLLTSLLRTHYFVLRLATPADAARRHGSHLLPQAMHCVVRFMPSWQFFLHARKLTKTR